jgi:ferredoxin/flavodoxin
MMNMALYYFSGTGNSLKIAKDLAEHFDHVSLIPIATRNGSVHPSDEHEMIGFVLPVYFYDMPAIVEQFVTQHSFTHACYIFAVVNCGGVIGNTLYSLDRVLQRKGQQLNAGFVIYMPDNSIVLSTKPEEQQKRFAQEPEQITSIAREIKQKKNYPPKYKGIVRNRMMKYLLLAIMKGYYRLNDKQCEHTRCNQCHVCVRICPTNNITETTGGLVWGNNCTQCYACLQWCPQQTIRFGRIRIGKKGQYHHPDITLSEMMI